MKDRLLRPLGVTTGSLVLLVLALLYLRGVAQAAPLCNNYKYLPGYTVQSCKENYRFNTNYWKGRMISKVVSGGNIAKLGWHWWTDTTYCNGQALYWYNYGSSYGFNTTFWASTSADHPIPPPQQCYSVEGRVAGNHYWETSGGASTTDSWYLPQQYR